ncbi:MAG TPA: PilN domain-containing protein [Vicinamibacterales bacterium]|nr:PilN domain-containing protein [Vicinamibacterales bacterium]
MIKVNLLATSGAQPPREWIPRGQRSAMLGLAMLLVTGAGVTGWWWYLGQERADVESRIAAAEADLVRLRAAAVLVEQASQRKATLTEKLSLIERLRVAKRGPLNLIETVSFSVPDGLWLLEIKQTGSTVQLDGRAMSLTSVTDFAERLQTSGLFKRPVEIVTTVAEVYEQTDVVRFVIRAEAAASLAPLAEPPAATPAQPGA